MDLRSRLTTCLVLESAFSPQFLDGDDYYLGHILGGVDVTNGKSHWVRGIGPSTTTSSGLRSIPLRAAFLDQLTYEGASVSRDISSLAMGQVGLSMPSALGLLRSPGSRVATPCTSSPTRTTGAGVLGYGWL